MTPDEILGSLETYGYVIIPDLIPPPLLGPLREASSRVIARARDESDAGWPHVRVVGKQFPPWPKDVREDVWGVQHIMHPDLGERVFAEWYGSQPVLDAVTTILGCGAKELQLELFNLLVNPTKTAFSLAWHRDSIPPEASTEVEIRLLKAPRYGTQWNTALYDDSCLLVVPGSHRRPRTDEEQRTMAEDPRAKLEGEIVVHLKTSDTVFYDNNILHRAVYPTEPVRQTLHASMGTVEAGVERARNILQHDMEWVRDVRFEGRLEGMMQNLVRLRDETGGQELGYNLEW
ncbi:hypothetical protein BZA05DRAFT_382972 [Tricharina praecox]|uniref:uncharacterized protein n=1 Tax=Tricharina praecox TaxID=43433 RepID=UPI00221F08E4|nr:uncharacterized protein BZA05DRAFT_382972 [Tricharina praecox]KAI5858970.1 hypothetical protein BZA05DRAFT_382972 [Tricharina praecox]